LVVDHSCSAQADARRSGAGHGLVCGNGIATVAAAEHDKEGDPVLALVTASDRARCCPGYGCGAGHSAA
jgi:hypothetical protein